MNESQKRRQRGREWVQELSDEQLIETFDRLPWMGQMKEVAAEEVATRFHDGVDGDAG